MSLILSGVLTLLQHADQLLKDPESYRPLRCPCGHGRVWCHGSYTRKPCCCDPVEQGCSPVLILRFYCPDCRATCSVLPECLPPRSWYLWKVRQIILLSLLSGINAQHYCNLRQRPRLSLRQYHQALVETVEGALCRTLLFAAQPLSLVGQVC